jgi:predicted amidohydrolase
VSRFLAAVLQLNGSSDLERNWREVERLACDARRRGAEFIATPENTNYLGPHAEKVRLAESLDGPTVRRFADLARQLGVHFLLGSYNEATDDARRCGNTSVLFSPAGSILATYRKIHLFDIDHSEVSFRESDTCLPGGEVVVVGTALGAVGLSICYDLRFGELYRELVDRGADLLLVPSAFTAVTGKDHWEPLLRARAIESQAWVLAPAQWGPHDDQGLKASHGHAMIVDPWGHVVASVPDGVGFALAEIDLERVRAVRRAMPLAAHRRLRETPEARTAASHPER